MKKFFWFYIGGFFKKNLISFNEKHFQPFICWDTKKIQKITQKYNKTGKIRRRVKKTFFISQIKFL